MTNCPLCHKEAELQDYKGDKLCPECVGFMNARDAEFAQSGLTRTQFFVKKVNEIFDRKKGNA